MAYYYIDGREIDKQSFDTGHIFCGYGIEERNGDFYLVKTNTQKIDELKQCLADTDYKAIKYAEGLLTDEEYAPVREQRKAWRAEINSLSE